MSSKAVRAWGGGKFVVTLPRNYFARVVLLPDDLCWIMCFAAFL